MNNLKKIFKDFNKDESGLILGIVLIELTIVGTVIGSVLMMSQISMESKGQSIEGLKNKNVIAQQAAKKITDRVIVEELATDLNNASTSANCGLPSDFEDTHIVCSIENGSNPNSNKVKIIFTNSQGEKETKIFNVPAKSNNDSNSD